MSEDLDKSATELDAFLRAWEDMDGPSRLLSMGELVDRVIKVGEENTKLRKLVGATKCAHCGLAFGQNPERETSSGPLPCGGKKHSEIYAALNANDTKVRGIDTVAESYKSDIELTAIESTEGCRTSPRDVLQLVAEIRALRESEAANTVGQTAVQMIERDENQRLREGVEDLTYERDKLKGAIAMMHTTINYRTRENQRLRKLTDSTLVVARLSLIDDNKRLREELANALDYCACGVVTTPCHACRKKAGTGHAPLTETNQSTDFVECDECRVKRSTPQHGTRSLCDGCINNKGLIANLKWQVKSWREAEIPVITNTDVIKSDD